jgi:hypothetical protein
MPLHSVDVIGEEIHRDYLRAAARSRLLRDTGDPSHPTRIDLALVKFGSLLTHAGTRLEHRRDHVTCEPCDIATVTRW